MTSIRMQVATSDKDQSLKMHKKIQRKAPGQLLEVLGDFLVFLQNRETFRFSEWFVMNFPRRLGYFLQN